MTTEPNEPNPSPDDDLEKQNETELPTDTTPPNTWMRDLESPQDAPHHIPDRIGPYTISAVIGQGGMGTVYKAMQESPRRSVALKVVKKGVTSRSARKRFEYEAQTLGRLRHENIAQIYEAGTHDSEGVTQPYFAMEYLPNAKSITDYAKEKNLGTKQRLALFSKVCDAVQHGHQKGIIHRDLKPGNILVTSNGIPKVIDFGVARSTDSDMAVTTLRTDLGQLIGTLQYMSPEQCDADPDDIDTRSDVYALGMVLYELLTDLPAYNIRNAAIHEAVRVIREEEPTSLSSVNRSLRGDIETMTFKALQKNRAIRYQSATELGQDIARYLRDEPISARPPGVIDKLRRFVRKHKAVATSAAVVLVILTASIVIITFYAAERNQREREAIMLEESSGQILNMVGYLTEQVGVTEYMSPVLIERVALLNSLDYKVERLYSDVLEMMQETLGEEHPHTIQALINLGYLHVTQDQFEKAGKQFALALDISRRIREKDHPETVDILMHMGVLMFVSKKYNKAKLYFTEATEGSRRLYGDEDVYTRSLVAYMGRGFFMEKNYVAALPYFMDCREAARHADDNLEVVELSILVSNLLQLQGRYLESETYLLNAVDTHKEQYGTENYGYLNLLSKLISLHQELHKVQPDEGHDAIASEHQTELEEIKQWLGKSQKR